MEKLPPTSYVRMVDVWLINGQLFPFIEVIILTVLELKREGITGINHHGFMRLFISFLSIHGYPHTNDIINQSYRINSSAIMVDAS